MLTAELTAAARTVAHVAEHFANLKRAVEQSLPIVEDSEKRGFFTPLEDNQLRNLLLSYWRSRQALIELVLELRDDSENKNYEKRPHAFLIAFTGALVLIDAARFLREKFHHSPAARAKLNEPEPNLGIPNRVYDSIQKSLTNPLHAWHLYHATHYYEQHRDELCEVAQGDAELKLLPPIIDALRHRLDISLTAYTTARARTQTRRLRTKFTRDFLGRALYGLQKAISSFAAEKYLKLGHQPNLPEIARQDLKRLLQPGDILITRKEHAITNYFLPGYWPHAALYLGLPSELESLGLSEVAHVKPRWQRLLSCDAEEPLRVVEAMRDGVHLRSLNVPFRCDGLAVVRPRFSKEQLAAALAASFLHEGKPYDFDFDFTRSDRLVCTEVVYRAYDGVGKVKFNLTPRAGRLTLAAEDFLRKAIQEEGLDLAGVISPPHGKGLLTGAAAKQCIQATT